MQRQPQPPNQPERGNTLQFTGTGHETRRLVRAIKNAFEELSSTNDQPYTVSLAIALAAPKSGLNDSMVKSYVETFSEAVNKFSNSEQLAVHFSIESLSPEFIKLSEEMRAKIAEQNAKLTFGNNLLDKVRSLYEASEKIEAAAEEKSGVPTKG